jgi:UDP-N-acetylmuramoylalanine--D-glutamate ligase
MQLRNKKFSILGIARSGLAAAKLISENGGLVFLSDNKSLDNINYSLEDIIQYEYELGGHSERVFDCDYLVVSPGVPINIPVIKEAEELGIEIINEIELGYRVLDSKAKIIAITGSNGKSTTTSLIYHLLESAGFKVAIGGNIGIPFTSYDLVNSEYDYFVLELSRFQLDLISTFKPEVAVLMNITPDHLNRYRDFDHYASSKFRIFMNQTGSDTAVIFDDDQTITKKSSSIPSNIMKFSMLNQVDAFALSTYELQVLNETISMGLSNIKASFLALSGLGLDLEILIPHLQTFYALEHRLEQVLVKDGVTYINDSKATNTDSVRFALMSFNTPIHIILGGSDKGEDFAILTPYLKQKAKEIYLIGETRNKMKECFKQMKISEYNTLEEAVKSANENALEDEVVMLSPACASFDMFKNFEDRGRIFKKIVRSL